MVNLISRLEWGHRYWMLEEVLGETVAIADLKAYPDIISSMD